MMEHERFTPEEKEPEESSLSSLEMPELPKVNAGELFRSLLPTLLAELLMTALMLGIYALAHCFKTDVLYGALLGTAASLLNFIIMILSLLRAEKAETPIKGQLFMRGIYLVRIVVLLAVLVLALKSGRFDPLATVLPLCFMRLALLIPQLKFRKRKGETT